MIATWMLQVIVASALLTLAALAVERLMRLWRKQTRTVWVVAMAASLLLPLLAVAQFAGLVPRLTSAPTILPLPVAPVRILAARSPLGTSQSAVDIGMVVTWLVASLALALRFFRASRAIARRRASWENAVVDGQRLLVSTDAGPAVIGIRRMTIVIPEWVLGLDRSLRSLVLQHEREHLERGDPRVLLAAVAVATLAPWNVVLWFQLHRLRSAMELDCDQRVLRVHPDARRYGSLLLAVAQRGDRGLLLAAALTEWNSLLARRISAMRSPLSSFRFTQSLLLGASAALAAVVACEMQSPAGPRKEKPVQVAANATYFEYQVEQPVAPATNSPTPRYPDMLRKAGVEGVVLAQFVVNPDGTADVGTFKVLKADHDLFVQSVRAALPSMRFKPAIVGGKAVRQLVQAPFSFSMTK